MNIHGPSLVYQRVVHSIFIVRLRVLRKSHKTFFGALGGLAALVLVLGVVWAATSSGLIGSSSTTVATEASMLRHLVRTSDGTLHSFVQIGTQSTTCAGGPKSGLLWYYSTDGGSTWTCGDQLSSDTTNLMSGSATVDGSDNVYVVYATTAAGSNASRDVFYRKLTKGSGATWTLGSAQTVLDANSSSAYTYASIEIDSTDKLWLAVRTYDNTNYQVAVYYSNGTTDAPTWTVSQAALTTATSNSTYLYPALVKVGSRIAIAYNALISGTASMRWRMRSDSDTVTDWRPEQIITTTTPTTPTFTLISDSQQNVYFAQNNGANVFFNFWNGSVWSAQATVATTAASNTFVSLASDASSVWVIYGDTTGLSSGLSGSRKLVYKKGTLPFSTTEFDTTGTGIVPYHDVFNSYWSYLSSVYTNDTTDAGNTTNADTQMLRLVGDIVYFGKTTKFDSLSWDLSTNGTSGVIAWEYWNGSAWSSLSFTASSNINFQGDGWGAFTDPANWATTTVNGEGSSYYYIRARVTTNFGTAPVGVQHAAIPLVNWSNFLPAPVSGSLIGSWTENASSPTKIRTGSASVTTTTPNTAVTAHAGINAVGYSTLAAATQPSTMRTIVRTSEGTLHAFVQAGTFGVCGSQTQAANGMGLIWVYSTDAGSTWTCGVQLSSDITNQFYASATIDSSDNIYVVYSVAAAGVSSAYDVYYRKLTKGSGASWTVEAQQTALDATSSTAFSYAVLETQSTTRLWIATRYFDSNNYQVNTYYSSDLSATPTWTLSKAALNTPSSSSADHFPTLVRFGTNMGVVYTASNNDQRWRFRKDSDGLTDWVAESIVSTENLSTPTFTAISDGSDNVYYAANGAANIYFSYWNGSVWTTTTTVTANAATDAFVGLTTDGNSVWITYGDITGLSTGLPGARRVSYKKGVAPFTAANFDTTATPLSSQHGTFDKYWSYVSSAYTNDTTDAANTTSADSQMVTAVNDSAYFGKTTKFDVVAWDVSTAGIAGQVTWEYWNGTTWVAITKFVSVTAPSFTADGYVAFIPPNDWATTTVNGEGTPYYYLRARTLRTFTTPPVGVQFSTIPQATWASALPLTTSNTLYALWTENGAAATRVRQIGVSVTPLESSLATTAPVVNPLAAYSSTTQATAFSTMRNVVTTSEGTIHAFVQAGSRLACGNASGTANNVGLVWVYSTDAGTTWTCGGQLSADLTNLRYASAAVDSDNNIYVVYSATANGSNVAYSAYYRKLTKGSGSTWSMGAQQTALDASSGTVGYSYAVIEADSNDRLWLASRYFDGVNYQVATYYSSDVSADPTWTVSQTSLGTASGSTSDHFPVIVKFGTRIGVIYNAQFPTSTQRWRFRNDSDGPTLWSAEMQVSTENMGGLTFTAIADSAGNVYHASNSGTSIFFSYWNGSVWSATTTVAATAASNTTVSLATDGASVWVVYTDTTGLSGSLVGNRRLAYKRGYAPFTATEFDTSPTQMISKHTTFTKYWSYFSAAFTDDTSDAANTTSADTQMLRSVGDASYFGSSAKFDTVSWALSTNGVAGIVTWEYWNGTTWKGLNDYLGVVNPSLTGSGYITFMPPSDWATGSVNGEGGSYYYVRARVTTAFSTAPVGIQLTTVPPLNWATYLPAPVSNALTGMWTENSAVPTVVRYGTTAVTTQTPNTAATQSISSAATLYSSLTTATQASTGRRLVHTSDGTLHLFVQAGVSAPCGDATAAANSMGLIWLYSTDSGVTWTCGGQLNTGATVSTFASATVDSSDNIYVVYSVAANGASVNNDVFYRKLTSGGSGTWTLEAEQTILDATSVQGYSYATVEIQGSTRLWVAVRYFDNTNYQVSAYYSDSLSASPTWTQSVGSLGTAGNSATNHFPTIVRLPSGIAILYNAQATSNLRWRTRSDSDGLSTWASEATVTSTNLTTPTFSAAADVSGNVYVAMNQTTNVFFTYWNGSGWSSNTTITTAAPSNAFVSLSLVGSTVYVYYGDATGLSSGLSGSRKYVYKKGVSPYGSGNFDAVATQVESYHGVFDKYWSYVGSTFTNDTTDAASTANADTQMLSGSGDAVYFGKNTKFDAISWDLSTNGTVGQIVWEYWNGSGWVALTDFMGVLAPSFTADGYISFVPPTDWATTAVNSEGSSYYYVRARASTSFSVAPVGVQVAAIPQINWVTTVGVDSNLYWAWGENATGPVRVKTSAYIFNVAPNLPTQLGPTNLVNGTATSSAQPTLQFRTSDINVGDTSTFQIQIDDSSDFSSPVVDYTSPLALNGTRTFTVGQAAGSGTYTAGSSGQSLSDGSYYWRVKSTDAALLESVYVTANLGLAAFSVDTTRPTTNASSLVMLRAAGGTAVASNGWTNSAAPYFSWSAGSDNAGGSGIQGYCLYLGTDGSADPVTTKGLLGTSPVATTGGNCQFIVATTSIDFATLSYRGATWLSTSSSPYYLTIKAIDTTGNVFNGATTQVSFRYDTVAPVNVGFISPASGSFSNVGDMSFSWPSSGASAASDATAGVLGWQYQINSISGPWLGATTSAALAVDYIPASESIHYLTTLQDGAAITKGSNTIYFRTVDTAGNVSSDATMRTGSLLYGGDAPSFANGSTVTITPSSSTTNEFALSWPSASVPVGRTLSKYYYMVNTNPPSTLSTLENNPATYIDVGTATSVSADALPGVNRGTNQVYVVGVDDQGNYSPSNYISGVFTLNSSNPDNVGNVTISDSSIKSEERWMVTLSWTLPAYLGADNITYVIHRSSDGVSFSAVGTTSGLSYVDNTPESAEYFYKIYTRDGASALSSGTNAVSITPTGRWTTAPTLDSGPTVSAITTRKATITWTTSRKADSKIAYGTSSGNYVPAEVANSTLSPGHSINLTGLNPGTTYYYVARWTDEDGNTGSSEEKTFTTAPAPSVKDVSILSAGLDSAIIKFTTSGASQVKLYYGKSTAFGGLKTLSTSSADATYTAQLTELEDGQKYYYRIDLLDVDGSQYEGTILDFETLPRPKISLVRVQQVKNTVKPTVLVSWKTNTPTSSIVTYYPTQAPSQASDEVNVTLQNGEHRMIIRGLEPEMPYSLVVKGRDKGGNEAASDVQTFTTATDTRPAVISNLKVEGSIQSGSDSEQPLAQLVISWATDEPATAQVEYGEGTGTTYTQKTQEDSNLTLNHVVVITGLTPSKVYHLRAVSKDKASNITPSIDTVTITPKATDNALNLVIGNLQQAFGFLGGL